MGFARRILQSMLASVIAQGTGRRRKSSVKGCKIASFAALGKKRRRCMPHGDRILEGQGSRKGHRDVSR